MRRLTYKEEPEAVEDAEAALKPASLVKSLSNIASTVKDAVSVRRPSVEGEPKRFGAFISHCKKEASMEARYLQMELAKRLGKPCFLDSDDLRSLDKLQHHVRESDVVVIVQSASVLSRPYCLLELVTAIDTSIPIVGVSLGSGSASHAYDFEEAVHFLTHLDTSLEAANSGAAEVLRAHGVELIEAAYKLSSTIPKTISLKLEIGASRRILEATIEDIASSIRGAALPPLSSPLDEWLQTRGTGTAGQNATQHGSGSLPPSAAPGKTGVKRSVLRPTKHVPQLPDSYAPRSHLFGALKAHVMAPSKKGDAACAKVVARGIGGVGKTVLAAAVVRDPEVLQCFDALAWVAIGQTPNLAALQRSVLQQLGGSSVPTDADESTLVEALSAASAGKRVLIVIDDPWDPTHEPALGCVDESTASVVFVTTRLRGLIKGAAEVELDTLSRDEALSLLLRAGDLPAPTMERPAPPAAFEAVELCGRLPLCIQVAGAMIQEHADDWEEWLVPALKQSHEGAELRESVEKRVLRASLQSIKAADRAGVTALFDFCAVFNEDVTIPAAVFDAIALDVVADARAAEFLAAASSRSPSKPPSTLGSSTPLAQPDSAPDTQPAPSLSVASTIVRRWLREALRHSLLLGSIATGVKQHDLVRDFSLARAAKRAGGLRAMHMRMLNALVARMPAGGFANLIVCSEAERGAELSFYVGQELPHHLAGAFDDAVPMGESGLADPIPAMLSADETSERQDLHEHVLKAFGVARLEKGAAECEARGWWWDAARLWRCSSLAAAGGGPKLRETLEHAIGALTKYRTEGSADASASDRAVATELEAKLINTLTSGIGTGYRMGSDEWKIMFERIKQLAELGSVGAKRLSMMHKFFPPFMNTKQRVLEMIDKEKLHLLRWDASSHLDELLSAFVDLSDCLSTVVAPQGATVHNTILSTRFPLSVGGTGEEAGPREWEETYLVVLMMLITEIYGRLHLAPEVISGAWGPGTPSSAALLRQAIGSYDFRRCHISIKSLMLRDDVMLYGLAGFSLALRAGDLASARADWSQASRAWAQVSRAVSLGHTHWERYGGENRFVRTTRALLLAMGDESMAAALFDNTFEGCAATDSQVEKRYTSFLSQSNMSFGIGNWEQEYEGRTLRHNSVTTSLFVGRALSCYLHPPSDEHLDSLLPTVEELLRITSTEVGWDVRVVGLQHPALLGAALYLRRGRVDDATRLTAEVIEHHLHTPFNRIEALRLLARCHTAAAAGGGGGDARALAAEALTRAIAEASSVGYRLLVALATRDLLRHHAACGNVAAAGAAREALRVHAQAMVASPAELSALLGEDLS